MWHTQNTSGLNRLGLEPALTLVRCRAKLNIRISTSARPPTLRSVHSTAMPDLILGARLDSETFRRSFANCQFLFAVKIQQADAETRGRRQESPSTHNAEYSVI